jgi:cytochrome c oxidase subunit 2
MRWFLPQASDVSVRSDALFFALLAVTGLVALTIAVLVVFFCLRYRRGANVDRSHVPTAHRGLEIGWSVATFAIFVGFFAWGAAVYAHLYRPVPDAMPVFIVGKQWMWRAQHPDGRREVGELHLPLGRPVRIVLATEDVIHSFFVPAFRVKQDAVPGRYTTMTFTPSIPGEFDLHCAEYCGTDHARMGGRVVVMADDAYQRWLAEVPSPGSMAARGAATFRRLGCGGCHDPNSTVHAPDLAGLFGRRVHLQDGRVITANEQYLRDSILLPKRDVVAGFEPIMPTFEGQVSEEEILEIIAHVKSLRGGER